ncbi:MAG: AraC family transcriptional regulator [Cyanobacteria bacterium P01_A01_bin.123]
MSRQPAAKEHVKFWRDPVLQDLEMLHATYITYTFSRHAHEGFGIAIVEAGAMAFDYRGETYIAPPGSVVVTHPGEMHTGHAVLETGWTYRTLLPAIDWLQQAAGELAERPSAIPYFASPVIHDKRLNQRLATLHRTLETSPSSLERESRFLWGMANLVRNYASDRPLVKSIGKEYRAVQRIRDYLMAHYTTNISLDELANLVELTPLRLLRTFRKQMGLPPHAYLNHVRVHEAKRLLAAGSSIIDAALATGFTDQSHLHRHFKKMLGITPGQYVRGCKNVQDLTMPLQIR